VLAHNDGRELQENDKVEWDMSCRSSKVLDWKRNQAIAGRPNTQQIG